MQDQTGEQSWIAGNTAKVKGSHEQKQGKKGQPSFVFKSKYDELSSSSKDFKKRMKVINLSMNYVFIECKIILIYLFHIDYVWIESQRGVWVDNQNISARQGKMLEQWNNPTDHYVCYCCFACNSFYLPSIQEEKLCYLCQFSENLQSRKEEHTWPNPVVKK